MDPNDQVVPRTEPNPGNPPANADVSAQKIPLETGELRPLLRLAWPLILSGSFQTVQITVDRLFLSRLDADFQAAALMASMVFWLPYILVYTTAGYISAFVAQYCGAGRPHRAGLACGQGVYFSLIAGGLMLLLIPLAPSIFALTDQSPRIQELEVQYFTCLCVFSIPGGITAAVGGFFSGLGRSVVVIYLSAIGTAVNAGLDYLLIFGHYGFPRWEMWGAGWATVAGATVTAGIGLLWMMRSTYVREFRSRDVFRFDFALFKRLCRFGIPGSLQWALDITAFNVFVILTGKFGDSELAATGLAITINNMAFIPMLGIGQAAAIMVGRYLGENRPERAARSTWLALGICAGYMAAVSLSYVLIPSLLIAPFQGDNSAEKWTPIAQSATIILWFVAGFSLFDSVNIVISSALRGAGDTIFVAVVSLLFAWPVMVVPSYLAWKNNWGVYWAWAFASLYIALQAVCLVLRFVQGKWKSMRVIEPHVVED